MVASSDEAFLRELRDRQEIHELLMLYCRGVDRWDAELIDATYWPDATFDSGTTRMSGPALGEQTVDLMRHIACTATMHFMGNSLIELESDVAFVETYALLYMTIEQDGKEFTRVRGSRYLDRFER